MAANGTSMVEELNAITECSICTEVFTDPRTLPCIHTFCFKCIKKIWRNKKPGAKLPCPLCREEFVIPKEGFVGLRKNFFMSRVVDVNKISSPPSNAKLCDVCREEADETRRMPPVALSFCVECCQNLCNECCNYHRNNTFLKAHRVVALGNKTDITELVKLTLCDRHPTKPLELFCSDCKSVICMVCFVESHNFHKCSDLNALIPEFRKQLRGDAQKVSNLIAEASRDSEMAKKAKSDLEDQFAMTEKTISKRTRKLKQLIDTHSKSLSDKLTQIKKSKLTEIDTTKEDIDQHLTILESFKSYCLSMAEKGSDSDICQATQELSKRADELQKTHKARVRRQVQPNSQQQLFQETELDGFLKQSNNNIIGTLKDLLVFKTPQTATSSSISLFGLEIQSETKLATTSKKRKSSDDNDGFFTEGTTKRCPPKKPLSAFSLFSQEQRPTVRAKYPDLNRCEIAQVLDQMWKACPNQAKYKAQAAKEKERQTAAGKRKRKSVRSTVLSASPCKASLEGKHARAGARKMLPTAKASACMEAKKSKCRKNTRKQVRKT